MTTVIYHSADYDGILCREIAKVSIRDKDVNFIGWTFGDLPLSFPKEGTVFIMDLPCDRVFNTEDNWYAHKDRIIWIDHHQSSIAETPVDIPGYRIDGVAACRLTYQWFVTAGGANLMLPRKNDYGVMLPSGQRTKYQVFEPLAVKLAGEYDVWDKPDARPDIFQYGLNFQEKINWETLLDCSKTGEAEVDRLLEVGRICQQYERQVNARIMRERSFMIEWEGLRFLTLTTAKCNSLTFEAKDKPETGHDALMAFYYNGKEWIFSLYHARHNTGIDLSLIAKKYKGGGHKGACGFQCKELPFIP